MAQVYDPEVNKDKKLIEMFSDNTTRVLIIFWHGLGDLVMFLNIFDELKVLYPKIHFDIGLPKGLGFSELVPDAVMITGDMLNVLNTLDYDIVAKVHFPMSEGQVKHTKGEWSCIHEIGIPPRNGHKNIASKGQNRLVGVHFNITCLPESANPNSATAELIWREIIEAGYIPIETHFLHAFHNPVNRKFDFINCTVRGAKPRVSSLIGLLQSCTAFIGVVSGNFHTALATIAPERVLFLEKHFKLECFTHLPVARVSIIPGEYPKGEVLKWLQSLDL